MRITSITCAGCLLLASLSGEAAVRVGETIRLWKGWNLVYLTVEPTESADAVFASWPVDKAASYEAGAFNATQQYSAETDGEGLSASTMKMWYAGEKNVESTFRTLRANGVYVVNCTNESFTTTLYGVPHAARCAWHATPDATSLANYVGLALDPAAGEVRLKDYFLGCTAGVTKMRRVSGYDTTTLEEEYAWGDVTGSAGEAFAFDATRATDWSGPVFVSPEAGVDFGTETTVSSLTLRNDSGTNVTVRLTLGADEGPSPKPLIQGLLVRLPAAKGGQWVSLSDKAPYDVALLPGATEIVPLALDRSKNAVGEVGGIIRFTDVSAKTHWQTAVPVGATVAAAAADWRLGLWVADMTVTETSFVNTNGEIVAAAANGTMKLRLPVCYVASGRRYLVQRVETYEDGEGNLCHLVGFDETNGWKLVRRYSSVVLPVHNPAILGTTNRTDDVLSFAWTVDANSRDNPFRHARHPAHDGLNATYDGLAPSGDNPDNYLNEVKPELFSLTNTVEMTFSENSGWTPAETLSGTCTWTVGQLHAAGPLFARGPFTMRRRIPGEVLIEPELAILGEEERKDEPDEEEEEGK